MSRNNAERQDGQEKKSPSLLKKIIVFVIVVLCVWGYARWSGKDEEIANKISAILSDKSENNAALDSNGARGTDSPVRRGNSVLDDSRQPIAPSERPGYPQTLPESFARTDPDSNRRAPSIFDSPRFDSSVIPAKPAQEETLPTESATAPPATIRHERAPERTAVLPPSIASGHAPSANLDSLPPPVLDVGGTLSPVKEDRIVLPAFIKDLARAMAQSYYPAGSHPEAGKSGISVLTLKGLNMRYGLGFYGFNVSAGNPQNARRAIFTYIMNPDMLNGLYALYADSLVGELSFEADRVTRDVRGHKRGLEPSEKADMFRLYARKARALSAGLAASCESGVENRLNAYQEAVRASAQANSKYVDATVEYEAATMDGKNTSLVLEKRDKAGAVYQRAMQRQSAARKDVLLFARKVARDSSLSDDTLLYALSWGQRRLRSGSNSRECVQTMARILDNLATRFDKRAEAFH